MNPSLPTNRFSSKLEVHLNPNMPNGAVPSNEMLFQVRDRLSPPPSPGALTSDSVIYVSPVAKSIGPPPVVHVGHCGGGGHRRFRMIYTANDSAVPFWH